MKDGEGCRERGRGEMKRVEKAREHPERGADFNPKDQHLQNSANGWHGTESCPQHLSESPAAQSF